MKSFALIIFALTVFGNTNALPRDQKDIADNIKEIINKIFSYVPSEIGIKDVNVVFPPTIFFGGDFNFSQATISGLNAFEIKTLNYDAATSHLDYEFNFKDIAAVVDYAFDITGLIKFKHHFSAHIDFKDIKTAGYAVVTIEGDKPKRVTEFNVLVTLGESDFDIEGFLNNDTISKEISEALTKHVAEIFDKITPILSPIFSEIFKIAINIALDLFG